MLELLQSGVEMRMIARNDWDDPWLGQKEREELVRCWRETK
jgi:hypothetical protein